MLLIWGISAFIGVIVLLIVRECTVQRAIKKGGKKPVEPKIVSNIELTPKQLQSFDGSDSDQPIYIAVDGIIYDVTSAARMYGAGKPYNVFAGRDATYALGSGSLKAESVSKPASLLTPKQVQRMQEWKQVYDRKYNRVGKLVSPKSSLFSSPQTTQ